MSISTPFLDLKKYEKLEKIEESDSKEFYKVTEQGGQQIYCAKILIKENIITTKKAANFLLPKVSKSEINELSRNIIQISKMHHPSILQFIGCTLNDFENHPNPVIITEYSPNGSLRSILDLQKQLKKISIWDDTKKLINIYGIASGMSYLHSCDIVHGELNTQNILMDDFLCPKINNFYNTKINLTRLTNRGKITATRTAKANDVYSFSLVMYEILTNETPVQGEKLIIRDESIPKCYQKLINECSLKDSYKRPTFDSIVELLRTDSHFIMESIEKVDFNDYVKFIDDYLKTVNSTKQIIQLKDFVSPTSSTYIEVNVDQLINQKYLRFRRKITFPEDVFDLLDADCQQLIRQADSGDSEKQFLLGKMLFEGSNKFPQNDEMGVDYIIEAINGGFVDSAIYYCQLILDKKLQKQPDPDEMEFILSPLLNEENPLLLTLYGRIKKKERNISVAKKYFKKASDAGDAEAMYEYGKILFKKSMELFEKSKINGCQKSDDYIMKQLQKKEENNQQTIVVTETEDFLESEINPIINEADQIDNKIEDKMISSSSFRLTKAERAIISKAKEAKSMKQLANDGDVAAMVQYGIALTKGEGIQKDLRAACHYFKRAADEGNAEGMLHYGIMLEHGYGIPINKRKACRYYRIASDKGNIEAMNYYGLMLLSGEGVEIDRRELYRYYNKRHNNDSEKVDKIKACHYFKVAADRGNVDAMLNYALMLLKGEGVQINKEESCRYFKAAADSGNTEAMMIYSSLLMKGEGIKINKEEACYYSRLAADGGNFKAMYDYGIMLFKGEGTSINKVESAKYLKMAADRGNSNAMLQYGLMLSNGDGVQINKEAACYYFKLAANKRNIEAMRNYGLMLAKGEGISIDKKKACFYLKKAADRGNVEAMLNYGLMSKKGEGVPVNKQEACKYFKNAADKGNVKAMLNYGLMLLKGEGVQINKRKACNYIKNAAYKGNVKAMLQYALMLENGEGVAVNKEEAQYYYKMAADKGNIEANVYYNIVSEEHQSELLSEQ
ncbi:hypothetical protein M9Y10_017871 [Tritrichomonas musculus]|uniref:Protein kinase domain-containing protein n=1 Tax=Tritrichomonas musculus TaxID=1915356 RepID=A0ABR2HWB6_9EUKA